MPQRRILSLWFPRLAADLALRQEPELADKVFAISEDLKGKRVLTSLSTLAEEAGISVGMGMADARAICPELITRTCDAARQAAFLAAFKRWIGRFSPWISQDSNATLRADITGCAHLFGGEADLANQLSAGCADLGLAAQIGVANTMGAAWAVARFQNCTSRPAHTGDAIDQEARATRSRATKRRSASFPPAGSVKHLVHIIPPDQMNEYLGPLPIAALRLPEGLVANLSRLGLRRVEDLTALPRATLARRFGIALVRQLDQAFGREPEPVSPEDAPMHFATRLSFPEPIGLEADILAGLDRLLFPLTAKLETAGRGARRLQFTITRSDHTIQILEVGLAQPTHKPERIRPLFTLQLSEIEAGFGIDCLRLQAHVTESISPEQHRGHVDAKGAAHSRISEIEDTAVHALIDRIGARLGTEAITRLHPADSHIPEKSSTLMTAAFSSPAADWPLHLSNRPALLFSPEILTPDDIRVPPASFRWRRRDHQNVAAFGPERIAPEWWLDEPEWRSGVRDYWQIETLEGARLWAFQTRTKDMAGTWYVHGDFS